MRTITSITPVDDIRRRRNAGNSCYYSVRKLLTFFQDDEGTGYNPTVFRYGSQMWCLVLNDEKLQLFTKKIFGKISRPKTDEVCG